MKDLNLLIWLTQLGISVAVPLGGTVWLAVWLRDTFSLGDWVVWVGIALGLYMAMTGFLGSLNMLSRFTKDKKKKTPRVGFNEHE